MSNARSPREVCSTTMGMSGLIVLALVSLRAADSSTRLAGPSVIRGGPQPAGRSDAGRLLGPLGAGRPQPLPGLRLADRDRLGAPGDQLPRLARGLFLAQVFPAPGRSQPLAPRGWLELEQERADVLAQLLEAVEAGVDGEVLVWLRQLLGLDLLHRHLERRPAPRQLGARVVLREGHLDRAHVARARPEQALLEARQQVPPAQLEQLVAALAPGQG